MPITLTTASGLLSCCGYHVRLSHSWLIRDHRGKGGVAEALVASASPWSSALYLTVTNHHQPNPVSGVVTNWKKDGRTDENII